MWMPYSLSFLSTRLVMRSDRLIRLVLVSCINHTNVVLKHLLQSTYLFWPDRLSDWFPVTQQSSFFLPLRTNFPDYLQQQIVLLWSKNTLLIFSHSFQVCPFAATCFDTTQKWKTEGKIAKHDISSPIQKVVDNAVIIMILWWCRKCVMMIVMMMTKMMTKMTKMTKMMTKMTTVMKTMILQGVQIANCPFHGHSYLFTSRITTMICWDHLGHDDYHEHLIIIIDLLLIIWYCKLKITSVLSKFHYFLFEFRDHEGFVVLQDFYRKITVLGRVLYVPNLPCLRIYSLVTMNTNSSKWFYICTHE